MRSEVQSSARPERSASILPDLARATALVVLYVVSGRVGLALGQGKTLAQVLEEIGEVAEGVTTASSAHKLAEKLGVEVPITTQVHAMLYEDKPAVQALMELMGRQRRAERDH